MEFPSVSFFPSTPTCAKQGNVQKAQPSAEKDDHSTEFQMSDCLGNLQKVSEKNPWISPIISKVAQYDIIQLLVSFKNVKALKQYPVSFSLQRTQDSWVLINIEKRCHCLIVKLTEALTNNLIVQWCWHHGFTGIPRRSIPGLLTTSIPMQQKRTGRKHTYLKVSKTNI